jgi:hypothetical protein
LEAISNPDIALDQNQATWQPTLPQNSGAERGPPTGLQPCIDRHAVQTNPAGDGSCLCAAFPIGRQTPRAAHPLQSSQLLLTIDEVHSCVPPRSFFALTEETSKIIQLYIMFYIIIDSHPFSKNPVAIPNSFIVKKENDGKKRQKGET